MEKKGYCIQPEKPLAEFPPLCIPAVMVKRHISDRSVSSLGCAGVSVVILVVADYPKGYTDPDGKNYLDREDYPPVENSDISGDNGLERLQSIARTITES
ncbi:MAG: hypothetical protein LBK64_03285, partial [Spirochaetaceae bacterium]|nr:hypothetical protein [Spirochaetaceae bacterium]